MLMGSCRVKSIYDFFVQKKKKKKSENEGVVKQTATFFCDKK